MKSCVSLITSIRRLEAGLLALSLLQSSLLALYHYYPEFLRAGIPLMLVISFVVSVSLAIRLSLIRVDLMDIRSSIADTTMELRTTQRLSSSSRSLIQKVQRLLGT